MTPTVIIYIDAADICISAAVICCQGQAWCQSHDLWGFSFRQVDNCAHLFSQSIKQPPITSCHSQNCLLTPITLIMILRGARKQSGFCFSSIDYKSGGRILEAELFLNLAAMIV